MQKYAVHFGRSCTKAMAKSVSQLKLSYETLQSAFEDNIDDRQAFYDCLRKAGITRKIWHEKIRTHFQGRIKAHVDSFFVGYLSSKNSFYKSTTRINSIHQRLHLLASSWSKQLLRDLLVITTAKTNILNAIEQIFSF